MDKKQKDVNVILGKRLRAEREKHRYTREAFAEKIDVSSRFLSDVEGGLVGVSLTTLKAMCCALDVSADYLLGLSQPDETDEALIALKSCINTLSPVSVKYAPRLLNALDDAVLQAEKRG